MTQRRKTTPKKSLEVTSLEQWKQKDDKTELLELPDGFVVRVRKLDMVDLAVSGYVPLSLVSTAMETGDKLQDPEQIATVSQDDLAKLNDMLQTVAMKAVVEPRITQTEEEDTIAVDSLGVMNLLAIFMASVDTVGAGMLRPFRSK